MRRLVAVFAALSSAACPAGDESSMRAPPEPDENCPSGTTRQENGLCAAPGIAACAPGFVADSSGFGCREIAPEVCPPGKRARIGRAACVAAVSSTCAEGFAAAESGWGCRDVSPESACTGAAFEKLGNPACADLEGCEDALSADASIFVDRTFSEAELDGAHFRTISAAIAAAPSGATIAVESGTYTESLLVERPMAIVGRCARDVIVRGPGDPLPGAWIRGARGVRIERMSLVRHDIGVEIDGGAQVVLRGLAIDDNQWNGVLVLQASELDVERSVVRATRSRADGSSGRGMSVQSRSKVRLVETAIVANREIGLYVSGAEARVTGRGVIVRDTALSALGEGGRGIEVIGGASIDLDRVALIANAELGMRIGGDGSRARFGSLVARDTAGGFGALVRDGGALEVRGGAFLSNRGTALAVHGAAAAGLEGVVLAGTRAKMDGAQAYGALAFEQGVLRIGSGAVIDNDGIGLYAEGRGSRVELTESLIAGARGDLAPGCAVSSGGVIAIRGSEITDSGAVGVIVGSEGGEVTLLQTIVEHTRGNTARETGGGIVANAGRVSVEESVLRANASIGIVVGPRRGSSASVEVRGSAIHDTAGREGLSSDDQEGFGVWVSRGSTLAMSGTDLRANEFAALGAQDGATVAIDRSVFRDTRKNRLGDFGEGIYSEADLSIADSAILGNTTIGLQLVGERSVARVTRTLIDGTLEKQPGVFGHGVMVLAGGVLELRASEVRGSAGVGVAVDDGSAIVEASLLRGNGVGLHVQGQARLTEVEVVPDRPPVFEVLITRDSRLVENGVRVGVGAIPVPDVVTGPRL